MIQYSSKPFGPYGTERIENGYYTVWSKDYKIVNKKSIFFSLLYNQIKDTLKKKKQIFFPYTNQTDLEFARFCSTILYNNQKTTVLNVNRAVNNFVGGDIELITSSVNIANRNKTCECVIYVCSSFSGSLGESISTLDLNYEKIKKKTFILADPSSKIYRSNRSLSINVTLNEFSIKKILLDDQTIITEKVNVSFLRNLTYSQFVNWTSVEDHVNKRGGVYIKRNVYGFGETVSMIIKTLAQSRYKIVYDHRNIGIFSCGVEGSGKSYLGERLSEIPGVVVLTDFSKSMIDRIIYHNSLWSPEETSMYLFYLDEAEKIFLNKILCSSFKESTGTSTFPKNIFIYATTNRSISEFDKSLYRTGRLQYQKWEYLNTSDVNGNKRWLNVLKTGISIRYVDYIVRGVSFLESIITDTQILYNNGVDIKQFTETPEKNRLNMSGYSILKEMKLCRIQTLTDLEYMSIRYKIDKNPNKTLAWYMNKIDIGDVNVFNLDFYVFIMD